MNRTLFSGRLVALIAVATIAVASCSTPAPPPEPPDPRTYMPPGDPPPPDEWNIFPDPTTGQVDIYHRGEYVGAVTGNEPADEDPPMPHRLTTPQP